jgi:hypothetical protein
MPEVKVPVIDCSGISGRLEEAQDTKCIAEFTKQLGDGMKELGFVCFINHGVNESIV